MTWPQEFLRWREAGDWERLASRPPLVSGLEVTFIYFMGNLGGPQAPTGPDLGAQTAEPLPLSVAGGFVLELESGSLWPSSAYSAPSGRRLSLSYD